MSTNFPPPTTAHFPYSSASLFALRIRPTHAFSLIHTSNMHTCTPTRSGCLSFLPSVVMCTHRRSPRCSRDKRSQEFYRNRRCSHAKNSSSLRAITPRGSSLTTLISAPAVLTGVAGEVALVRSWTLVHLAVALRLQFQKNLPLVWQSQIKMRGYIEAPALYDRRSHYAEGAFLGLRTPRSSKIESTRGRHSRLCQMETSRVPVYCMSMTPISKVKSISSGRGFAA